MLERGVPRFLEKIVVLDSRHIDILMVCRFRSLSIGG